MRGKKPGGCGGLFLGTRASSSGGVVSSGSNALRSLGAVTPTSGSTMGIGDGAPHAETGSLDPSQPHLIF